MVGAAGFSRFRYEVALETDDGWVERRVSIFKVEKGHRSLHQRRDKLVTERIFKSTENQEYIRSFESRQDLENLRCLT